MLRSKPRLKYNGLTVILSNPSRFDKMNLLSATGGVLFNNVCLQPEFNVMQCDVRLSADKTPFLPDTKCILLLGQESMHEWVPNTNNNTLNEMRGSPLYVGSTPAMASFFPQDAADIKDHESRLNPDSKNYTGEESSEVDEDEGDVKRYSTTKRANYAWWLKQDVRKCKDLLRSGARTWPVEKEPIYKIYPPADEVINILTKTKDCYLDFDIETDYEERNLLCFAFSFNQKQLGTETANKTVYAVPVLNHEYKWAYSTIPHIIRALAIAIRDNELVAHNGAGFDFIVLGSKYHIPVYKVYDTMLAMHRCFPDIEKSLGHCTSFWTYQPFHKDTDSRAYSTQQHLLQKLNYCAKDVFTMSLIREAINKYASTVVGLGDSIACANRSIRPYLTTMLQGIRYSEDRVKSISDENDRLMMQYLRIIDILMGPAAKVECKNAIKSKQAKAFPSSNKQCCDYFHRQLDYPVVARSPKTQEPSLGKKAMYKLALKHDNPVITFSLLYRGIQKEYSSLQFIPFKDDNGKIVNQTEWIESHA